jgi:hypothetical protein
MRQALPSIEHVACPRHVGQALDCGSGLNNSGLSFCTDGCALPWASVFNTLGKQHI